MSSFGMCMCLLVDSSEIYYAGAFGFGFEYIIRFSRCREVHEEMFCASLMPKIL
jgi:hypothetical protein